MTQTPRRHTSDETRLKNKFLASLTQPCDLTNEPEPDDQQIEAVLVDMERSKDFFRGYQE
ncbi:MAG: hypothetical protein ACRYFR_14260 [Janthinobacterium lividum]